MSATWVTQENGRLTLDATAGALSRTLPITVGPQYGGANRTVSVYLSFTSGASNQVNGATAGFVKLWNPRPGVGVKIGTVQRVTAHAVTLGGSAVNGNTASAALLAGSTVMNGVGVTAIGNGSTAGTSTFELTVSEPAGPLELNLTLAGGILTLDYEIRVAYDLS